MSHKFVIDVHGTNARSYHTNVQVGRTRIEHYTKSFTYDQIRREQGRILADMVQELFCQKDIESVFVEPYEVSVHGRFWGDFGKVDWGQINKIVQRAFRRLDQGEVDNGRVLIEKFGNTLRGYHTNFEISKDQIEIFYRPLAESSESNLTKVGNVGARLVRNVLALSGVVEIFIKPYELTVKIGHAFDLDERVNGTSLEEQIHEIFNSIFDPDLTFLPK